MCSVFSIYRYSTSDNSECWLSFPRCWSLCHYTHGHMQSINFLAGYVSLQSSPHSLHGSICHTDIAKKKTLLTVFNGSGCCRQPSLCLRPPISRLFFKHDTSQSGTHYIQWYPSEKHQWRHFTAKSDDFTAPPSVRVVFKAIRLYL